LTTAQTIAFTITMRLAFGDAEVSTSHRVTRSKDFPGRSIIDRKIV